MNNKKLPLIIGATLITTALGATLVSADTGTSNTTQPNSHHKRGGMMRGDMMKNGTFGKVTALSGNTITITTRTPGSTTETTLTVDATNATIDKDGSTGTISSITVGDMIMVEGTTSGTTITATKIHDGHGMRGDRMGHGSTSPMMRGDMGMMMGNVKGNGQPIMGGKVTAISGNTITIVNDGGITYTIDASTATVTKNGSTGTLSSITVGEKIIVQGKVNETNVTASSIIDQGVEQDMIPSTNTTQGATNDAPEQGNDNGGHFFGIGRFFSKLFGF